MFLKLKGNRWLPLEPGQVYLLGKQIPDIKEKSNFIEIEEDEDVNQRHCVIEISQSEEAYVYDLFSLKGTLLNNKHISQMKRTLLKAGDILKLGNQEVKYFYDVQEVISQSHDSSGFLEGNKNNSDIIVSSPDSTFQHESRMKQHINYNNFLVPPVPSKKSVTPNKNLDVSATEVNTSKNPLNDSTSSLSSCNRRSDSFTIPETQYCGPQSSSNTSDLSITESIPENNASKIKLNFGNLDHFEDDDEFCIPETQDVLKEQGIICSQRPRLLSQGYNEDNDKGIEELLKTTNVNSNGGSQFRICTQDYNEGFGEEAGDYSHSQIIPLITHNTVIFNNAIKSTKEDSKNQSKIECEDKEILAVKWSSSKMDNEDTELRVDCSTPDIFDFDLRNNINASNVINKQTINKDQQPNLVDEEDFLPTQVLPLPSATAVKNKSLNLQDKPCLEKENEEVLILSDKENRYPVTLEPVTEASCLQLLDVLAARPNTSSFSRHNISVAPKTSPITGAENKNGSKSLLDVDEEDDLLTQAFLQPSNPPNCCTSSSNNIQPVKCFNSTLLDDKVMEKNPSLFFAEIDKTPLKETSSLVAAFKLPDFSVLKKTSSGASATSESDLDLLMCTPQLIKENIFVGKTEDLRKNILAAKNKNLFGEDTDEEEEEDEDPNNLVKLINIPKDSLDFDKLLPHLNNNSKHNEINEEQKAANENQKVYKFNISFGKELDEKQSKTSISNSSTLSRDERHAARDKEKNLAEYKEQRKTRKKNLTKNKGNETAKSKDREEYSDAGEELTTTRNKSNYSKSGKHKNKNEQTELISTTSEENQETYKQEHTTRLRKRHVSADKTEKAKESKSEEKTQEMPAKRMTRSKSRFEEAPSTSKQATQSTQSNKDDLDSIATQPLVRATRIRSSSKRNEFQGDIAPNSSTHKSDQHKIENESSVSNNSFVNDKMTKKTAVNRKRKADETPPVIPDKLVRKRLKSACPDSLASSTSTKTLTSSSKISISMTMVDYELFGKLVKYSKGFWGVAKDPADSDLLVMDNAFRTFKFLLAMARGIPIVTSEYLKKLNETHSTRKVKINDYAFTDAEFEKKHKFSLAKSLQVAKKTKIFKGYEFVLTPSILPNPQEITAIIEASGGSVCKTTIPAPKENQKLYLVTANKDQKDWHKYRRLNKDIKIVSTEAIMSAVMRQTCERMTSYSLA